MNRRVCVQLVGSLILATLLVALAPQATVEVARAVQEAEEYGMALNQRFHQIHADATGMECTQCHVEEAPLEVAQPSSEAPGLVDRRVCLGCHLTGPGPEFYDPKE